MKQQEKKLLARLRKGDEKAVGFWFKKYYPKLIKVALLKLSNENIAQELVQETFIHSLKQLPLFKGRSSLLTWMQSILRHEIADHYRKQYAKKAIRTLPLGDMLLSNPIDDSSEVSQNVKHVLANMVKNHRELLMLKYIDKRKVKDIAFDLGKSVKSIESDLFRARVEFRKLYVSMA